MSPDKRTVLVLFFAFDVIIAAGLGVLFTSAGLPSWPVGAPAVSYESSPARILPRAAPNAGPSTRPALDPPFIRTWPTAGPTLTMSPSHRPAVAKPTASHDVSPTGIQAVAQPPAESPAPPESAYITRVVGHAQALALSCESRSASDWAAAFGYHVDELEFLNALPASDDPDRGFVGDVHGDWGQVPPNAYGVHAGPVARLLNHYGVPANFQLFMRFETLQAEIAAGRPVMVWITGHVEAGTGQPFTGADGHRTVVAPFEHTVIVVGFDATTVTVVDGARQYSKPTEQFLASWQALRSMAITASP